MLKVRRKWGSYRTLLRLPFLCIKILRFDPHESLSYQKHSYRSEFWVMLKGFGHIRLQKKDWIKSYPLTQLLDTAYIKKGVWHIFVNENEPSYFLEVQWGPFVTEYDIERKYYGKKG